MRQLQKFTFWINWQLTDYLATRNALNCAFSWLRIKISGLIWCVHTYLAFKCISIRRSYLHAASTATATTTATAAAAATATAAAAAAVWSARPSSCHALRLLISILFLFSFFKLIYANSTRLARFQFTCFFDFTPIFRHFFFWGLESCTRCGKCRRIAAEHIANSLLL